MTPDSHSPWEHGLFNQRSPLLFKEQVLVLAANIMNIRQKQLGNARQLDWLSSLSSLSSGHLIAVVFLDFLPKLPECPGCHRLHLPQCVGVCSPSNPGASSTTKQPKFKETHHLGWKMWNIATSFFSRYLSRIFQGIPIFLAICSIQGIMAAFFSRSEGMMPMTRMAARTRGDLGRSVASWSS